MKRIVIYLLIFVAGGVLLSPFLSRASGDKRIGIQAPDGTKHYIPEVIVAKKDCEEFVRWRNHLAKPGFVPTQDCPWALKHKGIGRFTLNGVELHIPREYLWQGSKDPDGPARDNALYLMISYPSMKAASPNGDQKNNIVVTLKGIRKDIEFKAHNAGYDTRTGLYPEGYVPDMDRFRKRMEEKGISVPHYEPLPVERNQPIFIRHINWLGLDYYEVPMRSYELDVFLKGNPLKPEEWVVCEHNFNSRCYTVLQVNKDLWADVSYHQFPIFQDYQKLIPEIIKLINSFVVPKGE